MRHLKSGKKLGRNKSHRKALYNSLATALFEHKKIHTTEAKAKALRPFAEKIITRAKNALLKEQQGLLPEGQSIDVHSRREVGKFIKNKAVLQELFDTIAPVVISRNGGYTRIVKTGYRLGDAGAKALIELVDWSNPQEGPVSKKRKKKTVNKPKPLVQDVSDEKDEIIEDAKVETAEVEVKAEEASVETTEVEVKAEDTSIENSVDEDNTEDTNTDEKKSE